MTAKEKALSIIDKYKTFVTMWSGDVQTSNENVRMCSRIVVDEIIKALDITSGHLTLTDVDFQETLKDIEFWEDVKLQIDNLCLNYSPHDRTSF